MLPTLSQLPFSMGKSHLWVGTHGEPISMPKCATDVCSCGKICFLHAGESRTEPVGCSTTTDAFDEHSSNFTSPSVLVGTSFFDHDGQ